MSENTKKEPKSWEIFSAGELLCARLSSKPIYISPAWKVLLPHPLYLFIRAGQKNTDPILRFGGRGPVHASFS